MTKNKRYLFVFLPLVVFAICMHLALIGLEAFQVDWSTMLKLDVVISILFIAGAFIIAPGFVKDPDSFVNRFLVLTTLQMLAMLSLLAALVYVKVPDMRGIGFHSISIFIILLMIQSILLIRLVNKD